MQDQLGATEFFDGTSGPVTRKAKVIKMLEDSAFSALVMQFPVVQQAPPLPDGSGTGAAAAGLTFPATFELRDVKSFQLASGSIQVIYNV